MVRKLKSGVSDNLITQWVVDFPRHIWLAGLGAFGRIESEGSRFFGYLVQEGEEFEAGLMKSTHNRFEEIRERTSDAWNRFEQLFGDLIAKVLQQLDIATDKDIAEIAKRVDVLSVNIKALSK